MENKDEFKRVFIIGAGASVDAGVPLGKDLLRECVMAAEKSKDLKQESERVLKRLELIYPKFNHDKADTWSNFEEYLDVIFDFSNGTEFINIELPIELKNVKNGLDKDAMQILYWFLFDKRNNSLDKSFEYMKYFAMTKNFSDDAFISLNYESFIEISLF